MTPPAWDLAGIAALITAVAGGGGFAAYRSRRQRNGNGSVPPHNHPEIMERLDSLSELVERERSEGAAAHAELHKRVNRIAEDIAYIRGKLAAGGGAGGAASL